jgi:hypothetical protein
VPGPRGHELGVRGRLVREGRHAEHPVADLEARDALPQRLDGAGDVPADGERRVAHAPARGSRLPVDGVDARRGDADEHLGRRGLRDRHLDDVQDLGPPSSSWRIVRIVVMADT